MKLTFKEKAKLFWERNKVDIISWLAFIGVTGIISAAVSNQVDKARKMHEEEIARQRAESEAKRKAEIEEARKQDEAEANDPNNQLSCGGYVSPDDNNLYEPDWPSLQAKSVPLSSLGEFGEEIIRRLREEYPDCEEIGPFVPETAAADVYIDFEHQLYLEYQKWLEDHPESQEKQAS